MDECHHLLTVVVPVYQNEDNLDNTVPALLKLRDRLSDYRLELLFVDDGSTDRSHQILLGYHQSHPDVVTIVKLTRNFGQHPAILTGLRAAKGDCIGVISADLQDPCDLFSQMVSRWKDGVQLVIAEREDREDGALSRLFSSIYWRLLARHAIQGFPRNGFDFCLMDKRIKNDLIEINEKNCVIFPLIFWLGYSHEIIHYKRRRRSRGKSQWTPSKKVKLFIDTFVSFSYLPLRIVSLLGIVASSLAVLSGFSLLTRWLFFGSSLQCLPSVLTLISIFGGLILFSIGIIGEYIWRILEECRNRPIAVVSDIVERQANMESHSD